MKKIFFTFLFCILPQVSSAVTFQDFYYSGTTPTTQAAKVISVIPNVPLLCQAIMNGRILNSNGGAVDITERIFIRDGVLTNSNTASGPILAQFNLPYDAATMIQVHDDAWDDNSRQGPTTLVGIVTSKTGKLSVECSWAGTGNVNYAFNMDRVLCYLSCSTMQ